MISVFGYCCAEWINIPVKLFAFCDVIPGTFVFGRVYVQGAGFMIVLELVSLIIRIPSRTLFCKKCWVNSHLLRVGIKSPMAVTYLPTYTPWLWWFFFIGPYSAHLSYLSNRCSIHLHNIVFWAISFNQFTTTYFELRISVQVLSINDSLDCSNSNSLSALVAATYR